MKRFVLAAVLACSFVVALSAQPAHAQFGRMRGYGGRAGGAYYGSYYSPYSYGYSPYTYGYSSWSYPYSTGYYTPYAASNYGWSSAYAGVPGYRGYYSYREPYYSTGSYVTPSTWDTNNPQYSVDARTMNTYRSFYSPEQDSNQTTIRVLVPDPNAKVTFDDSTTQQMGTDRLFITPQLDPNKTYSYTVKATWMENGKEVTRSQEAKVQPGRQVTVDFRTATGDQPLPLPREDRRELREERREERRNEIPKQPD
jgi:uncharacterized protein (TIGR03000 family)